MKTDDWPAATTFGDCQHGTCTGSSVGNHRLRISADLTAGAAILRIDVAWRRKDNVSTKAVIARVAGAPLRNFAAIKMTPSFVSFVVDTTEAMRLRRHSQLQVTAQLEILVYYMPYQYGPMQWGEEVS